GPLHGVLGRDGREVGAHTLAVGRVGGQGGHVDGGADEQVGAGAEGAQRLVDGDGFGGAVGPAGGGAGRPDPGECGGGDDGSGHRPGFLHAGNLSSQADATG